MSCLMANSSISFSLIFSFTYFLELSVNFSIVLIASILSISNRFIAYGIQYTFPYILMDEYQDTNPIQNKILNILSNKKNITYIYI